MLRFDYFFPAFGQITDMDTAGATKYYSYTTAKQYWLIQQWNTTTNTFRYIAGYGYYTVAWAGRGTQSYDYLYNVLS
jgi:hypothetical protein